ncbi:MAG: amidase [Bacteroidales bacterium]|nr:amidase [Bacteroidales bacterium]
MLTSKSYLSETANALRTNTIDVNEYVKQICKIIDTNEAKIQALLPENNRIERLLKEATELKKRFPDTTKRPPLFGVPVGIKDIIHVNRFETKAGSNLPSELFQGAEASVVTKLKNAGAIILGKTVTTEFAYFEPGPTRNPHNLKHTPGGSSSGSAAAVASGFTPLALGTQTIGSVTRPAAYCGIIGYKPTLGRIAKDGIIPFSVSADHVGMFTQDLNGLALTASIICNGWQTNFIEQNKKPVIGIVNGKYLKQATNEIIEYFEKIIEYLQKSGYTIIRLKAFENIEEINQKHKKMISAEFSIVHNEWFNTYEQLYKKATKDLILEGKNITIEELSKFRSGQVELRNNIEKQQKENKINIWLSPATTSPAPEGTNTGNPIMNLPWTYSGLPTITIPVGKTFNNLPVGLQFAGSFSEDEKLLGFVNEIYKNIKFEMGLDFM